MGIRCHLILKSIISSVLAINLRALINLISVWMMIKTTPNMKQAKQSM